jgi:hypothetical protein
MQQSSRRPPNYPTPTHAPAARPAAIPTAPAKRGSSAPPPRPAVARAYVNRPARGVVVRTLGLKILSVAGILHASLILMGIVVLLVMALGGDARVGMAVRTIKNGSGALWTWTLFALFTSFVLNAVLLYNAIATLSLIPWSERATKLWSAVWLALSVVAIVVNLGWVFPLLKDAAPDRFSFARTLIVTWLHIAAGVGWPAFVLFYMNTRGVRQAYARVAGGASAM